MSNTYPFRKKFPVTSGYGYRTYYLNGKKVRDFHKGIDFGTPKGTAILAPGYGKVTKWTDSSRAKYVSIFIDKARWDFIHIGKWNNKILNKKVKKGTVIAWSGNSGKFSTGPHTHVQIRPNYSANRNKFKDPKYVANLPIYGRYYLKDTNGKVRAHNNKKDFIYDKWKVHDNWTIELNGKNITSTFKKQKMSEITDLRELIDTLRNEKQIQIDKVSTLETENETLKVQIDSLTNKLKTCKDKQQKPTDEKFNLLKFIYEKISGVFKR